jgi:hypothetical protein
MAITNEFSPRSKNVDEIIDMIISAQQESGIESHMRKAIYDPVTNERINKFKRAKLEEKGVDLSSYTGSQCTGCQKNCNGKDNRPLSNIERGVFVYNEQDLIDDSDEGYICEYCNKIKYDNRYLPEVCDICDDCETCMEYRNGQCDGCEYSQIYNGMSYSAASGENSSGSMREEDQELFEEIDSDSPDYEVHYPTGNFTIMKYD